MAKNEPDRNEELNESAGQKKGRFKTLAIVGGLMLGEGALIFAVMSFVADPPESTLAAEDDLATSDPFNLDKETEVELCSVDAFNRKEGKLFVYHLQLAALVATEDVETVDRFVKAREASIKDRVQEVIRSADPAHLNDPALELIKRQLQLELNNLLGGRELISKVLISKMLQSRTNL